MAVLGLKNGQHFWILENGSKGIITMYRTRYPIALHLHSLFERSQGLHRKLSKPFMVNHNNIKDHLGTLHLF